MQWRLRALVQVPQKMWEAREPGDPPKAQADRIRDRRAQSMVELRIPKHARAIRLWRLRVRRKRRGLELRPRRCRGLRRAWAAACLHRKAWQPKALRPHDS